MVTRKIMLGLSFFDQTATVTETLKSFLNLHNSPYQVVLGLENEKSRSEVSPVLSSLQEQGWTTCYIWDDGVNRTALRLLDRESAMPFFANFSYGAAVNRLLLLATASGCEYLVRVDPGTASPLNIAKLIVQHTKAISQGKKVVSGQYSKRVAIRDDFVEEVQRTNYYTLVSSFTGIDCSPGCQITGGAAMTLSPDGPPAIVFESVRVWASDDGFYQMFLGAGETEIQNEIKIKRSEPGVGLQLSAYIGRVAAMVILRHAHEGSDTKLALQDACRFIQDLRAFVSSEFSYDPGATEEIVTTQVAAIYSGYENYRKLVEQWPSITQRLLGSLQPGELVAWDKSVQPNRAT